MQLNRLRKQSPRNPSTLIVNFVKKNSVKSSYFQTLSDLEASISTGGSSRFTKPEGNSFMQFQSLKFQPALILNGHIIDFVPLSSGKFPFETQVNSSNLTNIYIPNAQQNIRVCCKLSTSLPALHHKYQPHMRYTKTSFYSFFYIGEV